MLYAIAQMHERTDKIRRNEGNKSGQEDKNDTEYSVEALFPANSDMGVLYNKLKAIILSVDNTLVETPTANYIPFKKGKGNVISLWPRDGWIEAVLNAKLGTLTDNNNMIYDIANRKWSAAQYAFKYYSDTDTEAVRQLVKQTVELKSK